MDAAGCAIWGNRSPVTRYEIQWQQSDVADDDEAGWDDAGILVPTPPTNPEFTHDNLLGAKRYTYRVRAINSSGSSPYSTNVAAASTAAMGPGRDNVERHLRWRKRNPA